MPTQYVQPQLPVATRNALDRGEFDFLLPFSKAILRTDEVATAINRDQAYVRALVESGRLEAHRDSAFGTRKSNLITRRSVLLYLAETANYEPAYNVIRIEAILKTFTSTQLERIERFCAKRKEQIQ